MSRKPTANYTKSLDRLAELLRANPSTVKALAKRLRCSKPTLYAQIVALRGRGEKVSAVPMVTKTTGPKPTVYYIPS